MSKLLNAIAGFIWACLAWVGVELWVLADRKTLESMAKAESFRKARNDTTR